MADAVGKPADGGGTLIDVTLTRQDVAEDRANDNGRG